MKSKLPTNSSLYIATESSSGMHPYASTIVNTMKGDNTYGVFVSTISGDYKKSIAKNPGHYIFIDYPKTKIGRFLHKLFPIKVLVAILQLSKRNNIKSIHFLTQETILLVFLPLLKWKFNIYNTVHDFEFHELKFRNLYHFIESYLYFLIPLRVIMYSSKNLVTNSLHQKSKLENKFPNKSILYYPFPTLVTPAIQNGERIVPELEGIVDYILFFGRIELYKGVDQLYNTYLANKSLQIRKLVIAGSGTIYFERQFEREQDNVYFLNRFIEEDEIANLFLNAFIVVYPYYSATQSGVLSLALYFNKPLVLSRIEFFEEIIEPYKTGIFFENNESESLIDAIKAYDSDETKEFIILNQAESYNRIYLESELKRQINDIIC